MKTKKYQLKNGITVVLLESVKSPVVSIQAWVRTGSADESKSEKGLSHFIEHLLFKGTEKYQPGEVAKIIEGSGGEFNAYTSFDQTVFYVTISSEFSDTGLDVISQMIGYPSFIESEVDSEREVVVEEIKRGLDNSGRQLSRMLFSTMYKKHNYKHPVIGYEEIVRGSSVKKIRKFYRDRYSPKNMFVIVSGDFKNKEMEKSVENYFGPIESTKLRKVVRKKEEAQKRHRIKVEKSPFRETQGYIAWPVCGAKSKDVPALDVLALILGQGESSRIVKRARLDEHLVNSVGAMSYTPKDHGIFAVSYALTQENLKPALDVFMQEIVKICKEPPGREELQRAITNLQSEEYYSMETVDGIARKAGTFEFLFKDPTYIKEYNKSIQNLTGRDISRVAKKYFKPERLNLVAMCPEGEDEVTAVLKDFAKEYAAAFAAKSAKLPDKIKKDAEKTSRPLKFKRGGGGAQRRIEIEVETIGDGLKLIFAENPESHVSTFKLAAPGGLLSESSPGVSEVFGRVWSCGGGDFDETRLNREIEDIAGSLFAYSGRNSVGLSYESLSCFEKKGAALLQSVLLDPHLPESALQREIKAMREQIRNRDDNPTRTCVLQFNRGMFAGHPYERDSLGTLETLDRIERGDVQGFSEAFVSAGKSAIAVSGRVEKDFWRDFAKTWSDKSSSKSFEEDQEALFPEVTDDAHMYSKIEKEQSHLIVGYPGLSLTSPDRFTMSVLQAVLAGQGGRLFIELRDKASLAYTVAPLRFEGIDRGYFGAYIGCSPDKVEKAYQMMKDEFAKITDSKVADEELQRAKNYLIGKHDIGLQKTASVAYSVLYDEFYGNPASGLYSYAEDIRSVSAEKIQNLAQKIFSGPEIRSLVGSADPFS